MSVPETQFRDDLEAALEQINPMSSPPNETRRYRSNVCKVAFDRGVEVPGADRPWIGIHIQDGNPIKQVGGILHLELEVALTLRTMGDDKKAAKVSLDNLRDDVIACVFHHTLAGQLGVMFNPILTSYTNVRVEPEGEAEGLVNFRFEYRRCYQLNP